MGKSPKSPADAWKRGRAATVPVTAAWVGATGAVLNTVTDITPTGTFILGGVTVAATAVTAIGAWGTHIEERKAGLPGMNMWQGAYRTLCTCAAGSWITWSASTLPWDPYCAGTFVAGTLAAWFLYPWYRYTRREEIAAAVAARQADQPDGKGTVWEQILTAANQKGVREAELVETPGGYLLRLELPGNGRVTFKSLQAAQDRIEVIAGREISLRSGGLRFEATETPSVVLAHITERDVLAELIPLPHDMALIDSNSPFPIGLYEDGADMMWDFLAHGMVVGMTDAGKSNFLNVLIKKSAQMVDTLTMVIDPKGGRLVRPWVQPLLDQQIKRPIIDWAATNTGPRSGSRRSPDEWHNILTTACNEIDRRSSLQLGGQEKATTSVDLPRWVIIVDEVTDVVQDSALREKVTYIVRKGRSEGVIIILAGQRGTVTMFGSGDLKSQIRNRAGLGVTSQTDANSVFPNAPRLGRILTQLSHQGTALVQLGTRGRVLPGKTFRIEPAADIPALAVALSGRRPGLPEDATRYHGEAYTGRWSPERIRHFYVTESDQLKKPDTPTASPDRPTPPGHTFGDTARRLGLPPSRILAERGIGPTPDEQPAAEPKLSPQGAALVDDVEAFLAKQAPPPEPTVDVRRAHIRRLVLDAGRDGIETTEIFAALRRKYGDNWNRSVVQTWLSEDVQAQRMHRPAKGRYAHGPANPKS